MNIITIKIAKPDDTNFILGQAHFIKAVRGLTRSNGLQVTLSLTSD